MTSPAVYRAAFRVIDETLGKAVDATMSRDDLLAAVDQIRATVRQMALAVTTEPQPSSGLFCFGCVLQRHQAAANGVPAEQLPPLSPAEFVVEGRSLASCHVQLTAGPVMPGRRPSGLILGNGGGMPTGG